ncbi:hypothetical protein JCM10212_006278 [Sporobolomyces blumeae]
MARPPVPVQRLSSPGSTPSRLPVVSSLFVLLLVQLLAGVQASPRTADLAPRGGPAPPDPRLVPPHLVRTSHSPAPLPDSIRQFKFNSPPARQSPATEPARTDTAGDPDRADDPASFSLSPLVLAVTVDGQVHALKRDTGQWVWTLHDDGGVALGGIGRGSQEERLRRTRAGDAVGGPLVQSVGRRKAAHSVRSNDTGLSAGPSHAGTGDGNDDDETYIIEPSGDGDIYVFSRANGGLDKLPLSMAELVNLSPFRFPGDNSRMFSASKHTKFVGVDLKTGRLVGVFGSNAGWCEWDEADELVAGSKKERFDEDCEEDIAKRPEDLLYMARTEYHLSIYSSQSSSPLQTLSYTTYSSSTFPSPPSASSPNFPTQATWRQTPDSLYLQPMHDGSLVCFQAGRPGVHWSIDFESPVVGIFDVAIPTPSANPNSDDEVHPVMFEQPHPLLVSDLPLDFALLQQEPAATFIGRVNPLPEKGDPGELFAMSRDRFPLVPFAKLAGVVSEHDGESDRAGGIAGGMEPDDDSSRRRIDDLDTLIGRHRLRNPSPPSPIHLDSTLDPVPSTSEPLLIEAGPGASRQDAVPRVDPSPSRRTPHYPGSSTLLASVKSSVVRELGEHGQSSKVTLGVLLLVLAAWAWTKGKVPLFGKSAVKEEGGKNRRRRRRKGGQGQANANQVVESTDEREPALPPKSTPSSSASSRAGSVIDLPALNGLRRRSPSTPPTPTGLTFTPASPPPQRQRTRSSSLSLPAVLPVVSPLKALPPLPPSAFVDDAASAPLSSSELPPLPPSVPTNSLLPSLPVSSVLPPPSSSASSSPLLEHSPPLQNTTPSPLDEDGDSDSTPLADPAAPRKKNRRRRGGKGKKKAGQAMSKEGSLDDDLAAGGPDLDSITLGEKEVGPALDPQLVRGLSVSETILGTSSSTLTCLGLEGLTRLRFPGYGSHGTVVLRGEFQGRAVAVKRLLKDFVTIATHEVNLLQESDDHPHVIRYFCKEQRDTFLYIALELCLASLFDLVDQAASFPDLVAQLDPKKALKQIASGLRHLHNLKIVHRDIKPQNILVSTAKRGGGLRMLISDFGLCKKLDVDESSFQQTVNHAAGSFGYRAPEVLRGLVDPNETANNGAATPSLSVGSGGGGSTSTLASGSLGQSTDPSMRLTRSIDIFSLGCIFYYVLTRGEHPFGGRYEREMNILQGKASVDRLDGLGEEAVEVQDLILRMVASDPRERPTAEAVLLHPFFWNAQKRLLFICDASDRFEIMERDPPTSTLVALESKSQEIVGDDWTKALDRTLLDNLGKYRKYDGASLRDLLRVLRNKKHHWQDLPEPVRRNLGDLPGGFLSYFTTRFPHLLLHVYDTVATHLADEAMFSTTFKISEDEI